MIICLVLLTGIAIGRYLFKNVVNSSYTWMFVINSTMSLLALLYSIAFLKWRTTDRQQPLKGKNIIKDFFERQHVAATLSTLSKKRRHFGRLHLWLLLLAMMLYTFQRDEKPMSYLYTQKVFGWDFADFSDFRTFQSTLFVVGQLNNFFFFYKHFIKLILMVSTTFITVTLVGAPFFTKVVGLRDAWIIVLGASSHAAGRIFFALAEVPRVFYYGKYISIFQN